MNSKPTKFAATVISTALILFAADKCLALKGFKTDKIPTDYCADFRGKVTDEANKPLGHVKIRLIDKVTGEVKTASTGGDGEFSISTDWPHNLTIEFEPPPKKELAGAVFDDLPARQDRQLFVHLVRGFPVSGRVVYSGRPMKGMTIRALPENPDSQHEKIYGGGKTVTAGNGSFLLVLAPGRKRLVIYNNEYSNIAKETRRPISVSADLDLGEIDLLPPVQ